MLKCWPRWVRVKMLAKVISCYVYSGFKRCFCIFCFSSAFWRFFVSFWFIFCIRYLVLFGNCLFWGCLRFKRNVFRGFSPFFAHRPFRGDANKRAFSLTLFRGGFFGVLAFILLFLKPLVYRGVRQSPLFGGGAPKLQTTSVNRKKC